MSIIISNKFEIGQTVFVKSDKDQNARTIIAFYVSEKEIKYNARCGDSDLYFFDFELSLERDTIISTR